MCLQMGPNRIHADDSGDPPTIVMIHGAWSSPKVFNYILGQFELQQPCITLRHSTHNSLITNVRAMCDALESAGRVFFVAHSLGGIYASLLARQLNSRCVGGVTMATPYGGVSAAPVLGILFPVHRVLRDISPTSPLIRQAANISHPNWTQVVCKGVAVPWIVGDNDGVVSVDSQESVVGATLVHVECGHHEILQDTVVSSLIKERINH